MSECQLVVLGTLLSLLSGRLRLISLLSSSRLGLGLDTLLLSVTGYRLGLPWQHAKAGAVLRGY